MAQRHERKRIWKRSYPNILYAILLILCDAICKFPLKIFTYCIFSVDFKSLCAVECGTCVGGSGACRSFVCNRREDGCLLQEMGRFHTVMDVQRRIEKGRQFICEKCCWRRLSIALGIISEKIQLIFIFKTMEFMSVSSFNIPICSISDSRWSEFLSTDEGDDRSLRFTGSHWILQHSVCFVLNFVISIEKILQINGGGQWRRAVDLEISVPAKGNRQLAWLFRIHSASWML